MRAAGRLSWGAIAFSSLALAALPSAPAVGVSGTCVDSTSVAVNPTATAGTYTGTYSVPTGMGDCPVQVSASATDATGASLNGATSLLVDRTPPLISASTNAQPGPSGWYTAPVLVTFNATDQAGSGVAAVYVGPSQQCSPAFLPGCMRGAGPPAQGQVYLNGDGVYDITGFAVDYAGNVSAPISTTVRLDTIAPRTTASLSGPLGVGQTSWYSGPVSLSLSATDGGSGVARTEYSTDNGTTWRPYTSPVSFTQEGWQSVQARSVDVVGNVEPAQSVSFGVDTTPPSVPGGLRAVAGSSIGTLALSWQPATDTGSGVVGHVVAFTLKPSTGCPNPTSGYGLWSTGAASSATLGGLQSRSTYCVAVAAVDAAGNQGAFSAPIAARAR